MKNYMPSYIICNPSLLTGIVGRARACAGIGCVGKEEAGREIVVSFGEEVIVDPVNEVAVEVDALEAEPPEAICCICPIFPRSKFWSK